MIMKYNINLIQIDFQKKKKKTYPTWKAGKGCKREREGRKGKRKSKESYLPGRGQSMIKKVDGLRWPSPLHLVEGSL